MSKQIKIINNMLLIIDAIILFSSYTHVLDFSFTRLTICAIIVFALLIINFTQVKKKNKILDDKKYNIMFLSSNIVLLIILLRNMFDPMIPFGSVEEIYNFTSNNDLSNGLFLDYNTLFIAVMYSGILLYNLINGEQIKKTIKKDVI